MTRRSSPSRAGFDAADNGSRLAQLAVSSKRIRASTGGTSDDPEFSATGDLIDLYLSANPHGEAFITAKLVDVPGGEDGSTWRHYMVWRDKDTFLAMPYLATSPIMGGESYESYGSSFTKISTPNYIEQVGYSGESVRIINRSYSQVQYKVTKAKPTGGTDEITTAFVNPSEAVDVDPVDGDDLRAITKIEIVDALPAPGADTVVYHFLYGFFIKPSLQNTSLLVPFA